MACIRAMRHLRSTRTSISKYNIRFLLGVLVDSILTIGKEEDEEYEN